MGEKFNISNLNLYYGDFHALKNITMEMERNTVTAFIGPSGCGKSTFLRLLNRMNDLIPGTRLTGEILIDGKENEGAETDRRTPRQEVRVHTSELVVPKGKRAHLQLSDGTRVWINSASVLRFPSAFGDTRDVFVEGEAYFEVAKDANRPFIVHTDHFATRVLGTSFDVTTAPRADGSSAVVLVEGSVAIDVANGESVTLNPSERFSMKDGSYSVYEVDPYKYISWKDGLLFFTSNTLFEVLQKVAAFYKIEITCFGEIGSRKCTGKLILFDDLDGTLDVLSDIFRIAYVRGPDGSVAVRPAPDDCADAVYR